MEALNLKKFIRFYLEEVMPEKEKDCNTKEFKEFRKEADETFNKLLNQLNEEQTTDLYAFEECLAEMRYESEDYMFEKGRPVDIRILAYYPIPKSVSKKKQAMMIANELRPMKKPDTDNVVKVILDSLNQIAYHDDVQAVDCQVRKFYSENPRVVVTIEDAKPIVKEVSQ